MPGKPFPAFAVRLDDFLIRACLVLLHPGEKGWPKVEADPRVVVHNLAYPAIAIEDARSRIRRVTFRCDPLVPVMEWIGRFLSFHRFQPRVFPRRLVEVSMYADV